MTALPTFPGPSGITDAVAAGKDIAGLVARSAAGVPRAGILPVHTDALITGRADLKVDVAAFAAVIARSPGIRLGGNDGSVTVDVTVPASNTQYTVVYLKQNEAAFGDAGTTTVLAGATGTPNANLTTALANARANVPAGALEVGHVAVPSGTTQTTAGGVVITHTAPYTATEGGTVLLRNQTEQDAWAPHDGARAYRLDKSYGLVRRNGAWAPDAGAVRNVYTTLANGVVDNSVVHAGTVTNVSGESTDTTGFSTISGGVRVPTGTYLVEAQFSLGTNATGRAIAMVYLDGSEVVPSRMSGMVSDDKIPTSATVRVTGSTGDITVRFLKNVGGLSNVTGRIVITRLA